MEAFSNILDKLLIEMNASINEKITGINFLELIKFNLIENLQELDEKTINELKFTLSKNDFIEKNLNTGNRSIIYTIKYFDKSESKIKQKSKNDYLEIMIEGLKKISVFDNNKVNKYIRLNLFKNMGMVLGQETVFSAEIAKKSIVLSIFNN